MLFQLTILQLFSFEDAKDADNSLLEARGKDISIFLIFLFFSIFNFLRCAVVRFSLLFSTYVVFPLIYLLNILQFVLIGRFHGNVNQKCVLLNINMGESFAIFVKPIHPA